MPSVKKIAIFYPWGDILERRSGASRRVGLLIDFLMEKGYELRVIAPWLGHGAHKNNAHYSAYTRPRFNACVAWGARTFFRKLFFALTSGRCKDHDMMLWRHLDYNLDPAFAKYVEGVVDWADAVIVEYTFWARIIAGICHARNIKVAVTAHDILSNQITKTEWLKNLVLKAEIRGIKAADYAVCVSADDAAVFQRYGVSAVVIPHGIDMERYGSGFPKEVMDARLEGLGISGRNACLFLGSLFDANIKAVESIRRIAAQVRDNGVEVDFIVAGGCAAPERKDNFHSLGKVDEETLRVLYQHADVVLSPLISGTGASVKTIEAMGYGKAMLGTSIGFRGYPVRSGVHCIINDDLREYPAIIAGLFKGPEKMEMLGKNALEFAKAYDYRSVYQKYVELLNA